MRTIRKPAGTLVTATAVMLAVTAPAHQAQAGSGRSASSHGWVVISGANIDNAGALPSIALFGHEYEVVWTAKTSSATDAIQARRLTGTGKTTGGLVTVVGGWPSLQSDPTILSYSGQRLVAFAGHQNSGAYTTGAEYYTTSANGGTWTLNAGSLSGADGADHDTGNAVFNASGTMVTGMAEDQGVRYHVGVSASNPAPGTDPLTSTTGNSSYFPGLGLDQKSHTVWAAWFSNDGAGGHDGVWAQPILPNPGSRVHAPGSSASGGTTARGVEQDLSAASRVGGGVYTAYVTPLSRSVDVWKMGSTKALATFKDLRGPSSAVVAPAPGGRIWVYWRDGQGWHAARSNKRATRFGRTISLAAPTGMQVGLDIAGNAAAGPLEAVATEITSGGQNRVIATQVLPRLTVHSSSRTVARHHSFTVSVTDVGDPVKGAKVRFAGASYRTGARGTVKITVSGKTSRGKHEVTVSARGYHVAGTTIKVT